MARRTKLICLSGWRPDVRAAARRADGRIDRVVVAGLDDADRSAEGKGERRSGSQENNRA